MIVIHWYHILYTPQPPERLMKMCKDLYNHYISVLFLEMASVNYPFADESIASTACMVQLWVKARTC